MDLSTTASSLSRRPTFQKETRWRKLSQREKGWKKKGNRSCLPVDVYLERFLAGLLSVFFPPLLAFFYFLSIVDHGAASHHPRTLLEKAVYEVFQSLVTIFIDDVMRFDVIGARNEKRQIYYRSSNDKVKFIMVGQQRGDSGNLNFSALNGISPMLLLRAVELDDFERPVSIRRYSWTCRALSRSNEPLTTGIEVWAGLYYIPFERKWIVIYSEPVVGGCVSLRRRKWSWMNERRPCGWL